MKYILSLLVFALLLALPNAGTLQAGVTNDETVYVDVGYDVDIMVSVDIATANLQSEEPLTVCIKTAIFSFTAKPVAVKSEGTFKQKLRKRATKNRANFNVLYKQPRDAPTLRHLKQVYKL